MTHDEELLRLDELSRLDEFINMYTCDRGGRHRVYNLCSCSTGKPTKLSRKQLSVLAMWMLRGHLSSFVWAFEWNRGLQRRGKIDGNRTRGRWRTVRSLEKLGLLSIPAGHHSDTIWDLIKVTEDGRATFFAASRFEIGVHLEDGARETIRTLWRDWPGKLL